MQLHKRKPQTSKSLRFLVSHSQQKDQHKMPILQQNLQKHSLHIVPFNQPKKQLFYKQSQSQSQHKQPPQQHTSQPKKWQSIATKMNNQLYIQKIIYNRNSTGNMLAKYGGKDYRSQSKGKQIEQDQRKESLAKSRLSKRPITKESYQNDKTDKADESAVYKYLKHGQRKNLRKRSKLPTSYSNQISKQLSINKLFYENPVRKFGFNMQFEAKLTFQHLEKLLSYKGLQKDHYTNVNTRINENPIIYQLKDSPFNAHIITQKNQQSPICISLFPEFFHSKLSTSNHIRQRYLQKMKENMNNTYDPGVMGTMPMITTYPPFSMQAYVQILRLFVGNFQQLFDPKWAQNIIRRVKLPLNPTQTAHYLRQIWDLFNKSIGIVNLDYILKDQLYIEKFGISPYLSTKYITSKRILYHGGYSKYLYSGWANYVKQGRKGLQVKLKKYNQVTQSVWTWLLNFESKCFFEIDFIKVLNRPLNVTLFKKVQQRRISEMKQFLEETWMRGVILICQQQFFMQIDKNQYKESTSIEGEILREEIVRLRRDLNEIKGGNKAAVAVEQKVIEVYESYLQRVKAKAKRQIRSSSQLLPIYGNSSNKQNHSQSFSKKSSIIPPPMSQLKTLLTIHYSQLVQNSIKSLRSLIVQKKSRNQQKRQILRLTLIVDRQNIKFREKQQEIIDCFGQLLQQVFKHELKFFGLRMQMTQDLVNQKEEGDKDEKVYERRKNRFKSDGKDQDPIRMKGTQGFRETFKRQNSQSRKQSQQERPSQRQAYSYPQIKIVPISSQSQRQDPIQTFPTIPYVTDTVKHSQQLSQGIRYPYAFNHQKQINSLMFKLHEYYKQSLKVISLFEQFMPFIKLTTSKYIFYEQQDHGKTAQQILVKDLGILKRYRQQLNKIQPFQKVKVFGISCEQPLRQLRTRMNQVEYLTQQRYLNKIFDQIHEIQKKLNQIKNDIQIRQVKITNFDQLQHKIVHYQSQMLTVQTFLNQLQHKILFCLQVEKANTTLVLRYEQVVNKKKDLERELKAFKLNLRQSRPQLQKKVKNQCYDMAIQLNRLKQELYQLKQCYIDSGKVQNFIMNLDIFGQKVIKYDAKMKEYLQSAQYILSVQDIDQKIQQFTTLHTTYTIISQFWKGLFKFNSYIRLKYKDPIYRLNLTEFQSILTQSSAIINQINLQPVTSNKSFIHNCQQHFLHKFQEDIASCMSLKTVIATLCNSNIQQRHWIDYRCEGLREMTLYELIKEGVTRETTQKLQEMNARAEMEFRVFDVYQTIRKQLKAKKIRIIDVNGSDVLDIQLASQTLDMLYNWKIQCENLLSHSASTYFHTDIAKLLRVINSSFSHLTHWRQMEKSYIKITNYYVPNEENITQNNFVMFDQLRETHRKLIKSFDSNDSIWFISENIVLGFYCDEIQTKLVELQSTILDFMVGIRNKYPRLYLLTDEELLSMMSSGAKIQKLVSKCFRHIQQIEIKQGAIERIGRKKHLKFFQPMYILDKLSMVYEWMPRFQQTIKKNMRDLYKTNFISTITSSKKPLGFIDNYPLQLTVLDQLVEFTRNVEQSMGVNGLPSMLDVIRKRIHESVKNTNDSTLTLLYIKFRQTLNELITYDIATPSDFTWYRHARFYTPQSLTHIQPLIQITSHTYEYGFNYHQIPQIIFHQHCFFGNTFIGEEKTGKKSIARYYAYITGMEILLYDVGQEKQKGISGLVDWVKIAVWTGAWLYVDRMDQFTYEELCVVSQCIDAVSRALTIKQTKVSILGQEIKLHKDAKILMSLNTLDNEAIPCALIQKIRPMWVTKPNDTMLLKLFLQAKTYSYEKISDFLGFSSWVQHGEQYEKCMIEWVRKQSDKGCFRLNNLFVRMVQNGYLYKLKDLIGENDRNTQLLSNLARNSSLNLDDEISFVSYGGMLIYGDKNTGKTYNVLKILQKYSHLYVDMRLYEDKHKAVLEIVNNFNELNPVPLFLLIRDGIQFCEEFHYLVEDNVRLVFLESDLRFLHVSLLQNISTLNYNELVKKQYAQLYPHLQDRMHTHKEQLVLKQILGKNYDRIVQTLYLDLIVSLQALLQKQLPISNIKISFAKLFDSLMKAEYGEQASILFACIWTFGNYLEESQVMNALVDTFLPSDDRRRTQLVQSKLWNEKMVDFINKTNLWINQGKIQSILDLAPVPLSNNFSNNLSVKIDFALVSLDRRAVSLQLGMIKNLSLIRQLNPQWKIKLQARQWLSSIINQWLVIPNADTLILTEAQRLKFPQIVNKILYRVKKNKSTYVFPQVKHIVIDDIHLHGAQNYMYLEHLATYKSLLFLNNKKTEPHACNKKTQKPKISPTNAMLKNFSFHEVEPASVEINHFSNALTKVQLKNCGFTLGTKLNFTSPQNQKAICLKFRQPLIQNIYREYLRAFWNTHLTMDMGVNELFSISHHFSKKVQEQFSLAHYKQYPFYLEQKMSTIFDIRKTPPMQNKLFWLKNLLLLAMNSQPTNLSNVCLQYLKIMADVLPSEVQSIENIYLSAKLNITTEITQKSLHSSQLEITSSNKNIISNFQSKQLLSKRELKIASGTPSITPQNIKNMIIKSAEEKLNEINLKKVLDSHQIDQFLQAFLQQEQQFVSHQGSKRFQVQKVNSSIKLSNYMKEHILKVYRQLKHNSLILLGQLHTQRQKISKIACKLLGWKIVEFESFILVRKILVACEGLQKDEKIVVTFRSSDISKKNLENLFHIIKFNDFTPWMIHDDQHKQPIPQQKAKQILSKLRFILKVSLTPDDSTQQIYETYPMLKSHFVNIYFQAEPQDLMNLLDQFQEQKKVLKNGDTVLTNDLELQWKADILYLYQKYDLAKEFLISFPEFYHANKQSEYEKLQYYRKITSEMVVNIDRLSTYNRQIPTKLLETTEICYKIQERKTKIRKEVEKIRQSREETQQQIKYIEQLLQDSENNKDLLNDKMDKIMAPTATKMQKIQKKIQAMESGEFLKIKSLTKNQHVVLIVAIINLWMEEDMTDAQKQKPTYLTLPFTKISLLAALKDVKKLYSGLETVQKLEYIQLSQTKIKETRDKIEELKTLGVKKIQKNGVIFKLLFEWLMLYYERKTIFDDYYVKFKYTLTHLQTELSNLSQHSKELDKKDQSMKESVKKETLKEEQVRDPSSLKSSSKKEQQKTQKDQSKISKQPEPKQEQPLTKFKKIETEQKKPQDAISTKKLQNQSTIQDPTAIRRKLQQQKQNLNQLQFRIQLLNQEKQNLTQNEKALNKHKSYMTQKMQNLSSIITSLSDKQYMKNVSSNIASYFKNIPKISFLKTLFQLKYNEYLDDQRLEKYKLDMGHYFNVFSQNEGIRQFRIRYGLYHMLDDELECLYNVVMGSKPLVVVQDAQEIVQEELVNVSIANGYHVITVNYELVEDIEQFILKKIKNYSKILVLNTSYLNTHQDQKTFEDDANEPECQYQIWPRFDDFIYRCHQQLASFTTQSNQTQKKIIILNYTQPNIKTQFYKLTNHGKIHLTFQRFMTDITSIFQLVSPTTDDSGPNLTKLQKKDSFLDKLDKSQLLKREDPASSTSPSNPLQVATKKTQKTTKQLLAQVLKMHQAETNTKNYGQIIGKIPPEQIQLLINEQNKKMKQNLKNISNLTEIIIQKPYQVFQITDQEIAIRLQDQEQLIKEIEQNLSEISLIQEIIELNCKTSSNYRDQSQNNKAQLHKVALPFYWIFNYLKKISLQSESPIFGVRQIYKEWLKCLKNLKSQNHLLFNFQHSFSKKFEFNLQSSEPKQYRKQLEKENTVISDVFRTNIREIMKILIIKLGKSIAWQQRIQLCRFLIVCFIAFFISVDLAKAKPNVFRSVKELLQVLLKAQQLDKDIESKIEIVEKHLSKDYKTTAEDMKRTMDQFPVQRKLISFIVSTNQKQQKQYKYPIWVQLIRLFFKHQNTILELIECLRSKNTAQIYDQNILELYSRLETFYEIEQIINEVFNFKHHFQVIRSTLKGQSEEVLERIGGYQFNVSIDFKESEICSSLIIIEENEAAIGILLESLRQKAKIYKREWMSLLYNEQKFEQTFRHVKKIHQKGKTWAYLVNFSNSQSHINSLRKIMLELDKMPKNPTVKIFIIIPSKKSSSGSDQLSQKLLYNKYDITKIISKTALDFESLPDYIVECALRLQQPEQGNREQLFSIKTLQKIAATNKKIPNKSYTISKVYDSIIMGFRLLSDKHKLYNRKAICSHFVNFLKSYEDLYRRMDRNGKTGYMNAVKFIYQHFRAISDYSLETVKSQVQINLQLKGESLSYKKFGQGQVHLKPFSKRSHLLEQFTIDYLALGEGGKSSQLKNTGLKRKTVETQTEQSLKAFTKQAIVQIANQIVSESNQLYLKNAGINALSNDIVQTYYKTGLNIHRRNPELYQMFQQRNLSSLLDKFQQYIAKTTPVYNLKLWKNSIRDQMYKVRSADELLRILNYLKFLNLKSAMRRNNKSKGNRHNEKHHKGEYGFFVDKQKVEDCLSSRFILSKTINQDNNRDKQHQQEKPEQQQQLQQSKPYERRALQLSAYDLQEYFLYNKVLKETFALYLTHQNSKQQTTMIDKRYNEREKTSGLTKRQVEQIMERYVIVLDYSCKDLETKEKNTRNSPSGMVCLMQIFMK